MSLFKMKYAFAFQGDIIIIDDILPLPYNYKINGWVRYKDPRRLVHYAM
jgi:hypothetical protein